MIGHYDWAGGREAMLRFGPADGPVVVAAIPLLEEWNRTRAFVVTLLRALAARGIAGALPDMPGHGESLASLPDLPSLQEAMTAAMASVGRVTVALGLRSGALLDATAPYRSRWHLAPVDGTSLCRDVERVRLAGGTAADPAFLRSVEGAMLANGARVVRLATDPRPADRHVEGVALWRRAEPGNDPALAALLADDIADWLATCAA